jgi:hypothetical protein
MDYTAELFKIILGKRDVEEAIVRANAIIQEISNRHEHG